MKAIILSADEIVELLRGMYGPLYQQAADEIENLRAENKRLREQIDRLLGGHPF